MLDVMIMQDCDMLPTIVSVSHIKHVPSLIHALSETTHSNSAAIFIGASMIRHTLKKLAIRAAIYRHAYFRGADHLKLAFLPSGVARKKVYMISLMIYWRAHT